MARPRKRHLQQELRLAGPRRGKRKPGAGRKPKGPRSSERHKIREALSPRTPVHVTVRVARAVGNLRRRNVYRAMRFALYCAGRRDDFRVVHVSLQRTHIHFLVEANDAKRLARGMQGLLISAAKHVNRELDQRRGTVFPDRYHATQLRSPQACRNALAYVLNNWRKHGEHRDRRWLVDPFSSAVNFGGWKELEDSPILFPIPPTYDRMHTCFPRTWLLREGWQRHGLIGAREVPASTR